MNLSPEVCLEWKNLTYKVKTKNKAWWKSNKNSNDLIILNKVNGKLESGNLTAVLGASGAGKTTLLAAISQRARGNVTGEISINNIPIASDEMTKLSAFVPQFDILIKSLTVREHLHFMCELKMDKKTSIWTKLANIEKLLKQSGLENVSESRISILSGGEKRKLNVATELITEPPIIFCDEPTTGLDSFSALSVLTALKNLTKSKPLKSIDSAEMEIVPKVRLFEDHVDKGIKFKSKAVLCTIHQPTSEIFECFSNIILMHSGRIVYQGPIKEANKFFNKLGYVCPTSYNPAEFYLNLVSDSNDKKTEELAVEKIYDSYKLRCEPGILKFSSNVTSNREKLLKNYNIQRINWFLQFYQLLKRNGIDLTRNIFPLFVKLLFLLVTFGVMGLIYSKIELSKQSSVTDISGAIFIIITETVFENSYACLYTFYPRLPLIRREAGENLYYLSAFYVSDVLCLIPTKIIYTSISFGLFYILTNFITGFFMYLKIVLVLILTANAGSSYGYMLSGVFGTTASSFAPIFDLLFIAFGGYYLKGNAIPILKNLSIFFYANEAISITYWETVKYLECPSNGTPCMNNGTEVLTNSYMGTDSGEILYDFFGLGLVTLVLHILGFAGLYRYANNTGFY